MGKINKEHLTDLAARLTLASIAGVIFGVIFSLFSDNTAYAIVFGAVVGFIFLVTLAICKVAAESDQRSGELFREMLTNKEEENGREGENRRKGEGKTVTDLDEVFDMAADLKHGEVVTEKNGDKYFLPDYRI